MIQFHTFLVLFALLISAQGAFAQARYSAFARSFLLKVPERRELLAAGQPLQLTDAVKQEYLVRSTETGDVIHGMLQVRMDSVSMPELQRLGVKINSRIGNIWTAVIPVLSLRPLGAAAGILYIDIDSRVRRKLDAARADTRVQLVNDGTDLPRGYTGNGVVIGVIDGGFDYQHPTFSNAGGASRITRVWEQNGTGNPPAPFSYGAEYASATAIAALGESGSGSHGTHVAGIAGGSGARYESGKYKGVAHDAELVFVEMGSGTSSVVDAAKYIFDYAASQSKPAVINMSLGSHVGPHDGTSLQDQAFNGLVGEGKILVGAAGNEGGTPLHLSHAFGASQESIMSVVNFEDNGNQTGSGKVETWGSENSSFSIALRVYDATFTKVAESAVIASASNAAVQDSLVTANGTVLFEAVAVAKSPTNNRPNILMAIANPTEQFVVLVITATGSTVHAWNEGKGGGAAFTQLNGDPATVAGNTDYTVGEIGGTAAGVITVGAYTTKAVYTNSSGNPVDNAEPLGAIAPFSSRGPTLDGRVKPEITAPGNVVISAVRALDAGYNDGGKSRSELVVEADNGASGRYASMQGTSMATPMVCGIIALMLEVKPVLTPAQILSVFDNSSRTDTFTGTIPAGGTNTWGRGKIDAHASVKNLIAVTSTETDAGVTGFSLSQNYPNPVVAGSFGSPVTSIRFSLSNSQPVRLNVLDLHGREVATLVRGPMSTGAHIVRFDAGSLPAGTYLYVLQAGAARLTRMLSVMK